MATTDDMTKEEREEYCKNNDIPVSTFGYLERRFNDYEACNEGSRFAELLLPKVSEGSDKDLHLFSISRLHHFTFCVKMFPRH